MEEVDSFFALYSKADDIVNKARMSGEAQESTFLVKGVYVITKQALYDLPKDFGGTILGKFDNNGKFEMFKAKYRFSLFDKIEAIYELFKEKGINYTEPPSDKIHNVFKYDVEISISAKIVNEKEEVATEVVKIEKEIEEEKQIPLEAIEVIRKMPYLIGLLGIKKINIPVIVDSEIVLQSLQKDANLQLEPIADTLQDTLARKIGVISIGTEKMQPIYVPEMLGKDKIYFAYNNIPKNIINMLNSDRLIINNYTFKNDSKIIILFVKNIDEYLKSKTVSQKNGTYITDFLIAKEKNNLSILINSPPISATDFVKYTGYSLTDLDKMLSIYSYFVKAGIQAIDYRVIKILFDIFPESAIEETENIIYSASLVFCSYLMINGKSLPENFNELEEKIKAFVKENINIVEDKQLYKNDLRENLKSVFEISDYLASRIIETLDKSGYINIHEDGKTTTFEKQMLALFK